MVSPIMDQKIRKYIIVLFYLLPIIIFFVSLFIGPYNLSVNKIIELILKGPLTPDDAVTYTILFEIRLPRIILCLLIGCALSVSSAAFQSVLRNPLVSEYVLGVSSGAAFGASVAIAFFGKSFITQILAFFGGIVAVLLTYFLSRVRKETTVISLVLSGIITNAIFTSGNYIVRYLIEPEKLQHIVIWLMGSFSAANWNDVLSTFFFIILGSYILFMLRWQLNGISMGEEEAKSFGIEVEKVKVLVIVLSTLITSSAISVVGIIAWIGLMVPHIVRMVVGSDYRLVIPLSMSLGSFMLLVADNIVRTSKTIELPVGVVTTLIGAPFFAYLVKKNIAGSWE